MSALKPKHQRLALVVVALLAIVLAGLLAAWTLRNQADFFYLPDEMVEAPPPVGQAARLGGMVKAGSIQTLADGVTVEFVVTGKGDSQVPVRFSGIAPDLFVEGSGVVAEGSLQRDGTFLATNLLAKHDENYVPRELEELEGHEASKYAADTTVGLE